MKYLILMVILCVSNVFGMDLSRFSDNNEDRFSSAFDGEDLTAKFEKLRRAESNLVNGIVLVLQEDLEEQVMTRSITFKQMNAQFRSKSFHSALGLMTIYFTEEVNFETLVNAYQELGGVREVRKLDAREDIFRERQNKDYLTHRDSRRKASISQVKKK